MHQPLSDATMSGTSADSASLLSVRDLRRRWKPTKERLVKATRNGESHPLPIRLHRAFSWLAAVETLADSEQLDQRLIFRWIALNSLYGRWDGKIDEPTRDAESLRRFLSTIIRLDHDGLLAASLQTHKPLAMSILEDEYVNDYFWRMVREDRQFRPGRTRRLAEEWYREANWTKLLDELLDRVYLVRCQLIHGAATYDSKMNRETVRRCGLMLRIVMQSILIVMIDQGLTTDWGELCYPPISQSNSPAFPSARPSRPK
ncbi:MAG: hypothetical protein IT422_05975 [Pirellulaceae bacterium]|nr:hypothetical protein [Pirellulaceae bacterium]